MLRNLSKFHPSDKLNTTNVTKIYNHPDLMGVTEIIKSKFYFATFDRNKKGLLSIPGVYMFETDSHLQYNNFYDDFGPLNIACLYRYCRGINQILENPEFQVVVHYTSSCAESRANAVYLVSSYSILYLNKSPRLMYDTFSSNLALPLRPFQDAVVGASCYTITLFDCLSALAKASTLGFFNFDDFDVREYEKYEKYKNGDLNWIVPGKFIAFLGPSTETGSFLHYPEKYLNYFMKNEVAAVIRLNRKNYDAFRFASTGILHYEMFFPDGTIPPNHIVKQFLHVSETTRGPIAVHCKAGLGRTGTLIAAYLMKHYALTAREAIAWLRICRPGSVIGQQQAWLEENQQNLWRDGRRFRRKYHGDENLILHHKRGIYSIAAKFDRNKGLEKYCIDGKLEKTKSAILLENLKIPRLNVLANSHARSSSAYEDAESKKTAVNKKLEMKNKFLRSKENSTQGDKLNEIKIKRDNRTPKNLTGRDILRKF